MNRRKSLSFAGTAFLTWPIFRLPVLVLATSLVLAGQSNAADTRAPDIHLATADPVPDNKARVERPAPIVPVVIALGDRTSVLTYWVDEPDGFQTVSPGGVDGEDHHAIVRFSTSSSPARCKRFPYPDLTVRLRTRCIRPNRGALSRGRASR